MSLDAANQMLSNGEVLAAETVYQEMLAAAPQSWEANFGLARIARLRGDGAAALEFFEAAVAAHTAPPAALWAEVATELRELGRIDEAEALYFALLEVAPDSLHCRAGLGHCARRRDDRVASLAQFQAAVLIDPGFVGARLEVAADLRELGRLQDAEAAYQTLLQMAPDNFAARVGLAQCARRRDDRLESLAQFQAAALIEPDHAGARLEVAADLLALDRLTEAQVAFQALLETSPDNFAARVGLGHCARRRGDRLESLAQFQAATLIEPNHLGARLEAATDLRVLDRLDEAQAGYAAMLALAPGNIHAHFGLGQCARSRGDHAAALKHFEAASAADPANLAARMEIAACLGDLGRLEEAEALLQALLLEAPDNVQLHVGLGHNARRRGDKLASLAHFEAAAVLDTDSVAVALEVAHGLKDLDRLAEAEAGYGKLLALAPGNIYLLSGLAACARRRGDLEASLRHYEAALAVAPAHLALRLEHAANLREMGRLEEAEAAYTAICQSHPQDIWPQTGLAQCARHRGDLASALQHLQAAAEIDPSHLGVRVEIAAALRELNRVADAEAAYLALLQIAPENTQVLYGLGHCARRRGDYVAADGYFRRWAALEPDAVFPRLEIAAGQREVGDVEAALRTARQVLGDHPDDFGTLMQIGFTLRASGRHQEALEAFSTAHRAAPSQTAALLEMAVEERTLGHQAACDALLESALALEPRNVAVLVRLGEQALIAEDPKDTLAFFDAALREQPGQLSLELFRVQALAQSGRIEDGLARLEALEQQFGAMPGIVAQRLALLRQAGQHHLALRLAREAVAATPHFFQFWWERMQLELLVGAEAEVDDCLRQFPANTLDQRAMRLWFSGNLAENRWQLAAALDFYEQAAVLQPENGGLENDLARVSVLLLNDGEARRHLRAFVSLNAHLTRLQRKSLNISQSHFGQILDDYTLDQALLARLKEAVALPPVPRVAELERLVRQAPDSTAAAVTLMVALQQAGAWRRQPWVLDGGGIPARLTQFWDEDEPPEDIARIMQSWRQINPAYQCRLFNLKTAKAYLAERFVPAVGRAFQRVAEPAQKADIFRLALLAAEGGVYADADDRCLAPISAVLPEHAALVMYQEDHGTIGNNFIAAAPRHPVIVHALRLAVTAVNRGDADNVWLATGPALLTRAFAQSLALGAVKAADLGASVILLHRRELSQVVAIHCFAGYKKTERHWGNSSFVRRVKNKLPAAGGNDDRGGAVQAR